MIDSICIVIMRHICFLIIPIYVEIRITREVREEGESDKVGDVGKKMIQSSC